MTNLNQRISHVLEPTEAMCDGARSFLLGLEAGCNTFEAMRKHLHACGHDGFMPERLKAYCGHLSKWDKADMIYQMMVNAEGSPVNGMVESIKELLCRVEELEGCVK